MHRTYDYHGHTVEIRVEPETVRVPVVQPNSHPASPQRGASIPPTRGYVAIVDIRKSDQPIATFSPLRFGDIAGRPFLSETDAIMGGYSAARKIIDDLFSGNSR